MKNNNLCYLEQGTQGGAYCVMLASHVHRPSQSHSDIERSNLAEENGFSVKLEWLIIKGIILIKKITQKKPPKQNNNNKKTDGC